MSRAQLLSAPRVGAKLLSGNKARVKIPLGRTKGVLSKAEARWAASGFNPGLTPQYLKDLSGKGHHMRLGSVGRGDVIDGALVLPGSSGSYAATPNTTRTELITTGTHPDAANAATFEAATNGGWGPYGGNSSVARDTVTFRSGAASLKVTSLAAGAFYATSAYGTNSIPVTAGVQYSARAWVRPDATRSMRAQLVWLDAANNGAGSSLSSSVTITGATWAPVTVEGVAPVGAVRVALVVFSASAAAAAGEIFYIDDVSAWRSDADLNVEGDLEIVAEVSPDFYVGPRHQYIIAKLEGGIAGTNSYALRINSDGKVELLWASGLVPATLIEKISTVALPTADGAKTFIRATLDVADNSGNSVVTFYTGTSFEGPWSILGAPVVTAGATSVSTSTVAAEFGKLTNNPSVSLFGGRVHRVAVRSGIGGVSVLDVNFRNQPDGCAWFNEDAASRRVTVYPLHAVVVGGALYTPATGSQLARVASLAELDPSGDFELEVDVESLGNGLFDQQLMSKGYGGNPGWWLLLTSTNSLYFAWRVGGITYSTTLGSVNAQVLAAGGARLKVTREVAVGRVIGYYSLDKGASWVEIGRSNGLGTGIAMGSSGNNLSIGDGVNGKMRQAIVRAGVGAGAVTVFDCDFSKWGDGEGVAVPKKLPTGQYARIITDTGGADTNDPTFLPYWGERYVYLPGVAGNYVSSPDQAALDLAGNFTVEFDGAADDWTPAAQITLLSKYNASGNQRSFRFILGTSGTVLVQWSNDGLSTLMGSSSLAPLPVVDGARLKLRASVADVGSGNYRIRYYYRTDDSLPWTKLAADVSGAGAVTPFNGAAPLEIGSSGGGTTEMFVGRVFGAKLYNGAIDDGVGVPAHEFNSSLLAPPHRYYSPTANLLDKDTSDIEGSIGRWIVAQGTPTVVRSTAWGAGGSAASLLVTATAATTTVTQSGMFPVNPSTSYAFAATWRPNVSGKTHAMYVRWFDVNANAISTPQIANFTGTSGVESVTSGVAVSPSNAAFVEYFMDTSGSIAIGNSWHIDNIGIYEATGVPAWSAGGVPFTMNRANAGKRLAVVDRPTFLLGTDDYFECADHATLDFSALESFTLAAALRYYGSTSTYGRLFEKRNPSSGANAGYLLSMENLAHRPYFLMGDGAVGVGQNPATIAPVGSPQVFHARRNVALDRIEVAWDATVATASDVTTASLANVEVLRIGRAGSVSTNYFEGEWFGGAIWRQSLTDAEALQLKSLMGATA